MPSEERELELHTAIYLFDALFVIASMLIILKEMEKMRVSGKTFAQTFCPGFQVEKLQRFGVTARSHQLVCLGIPVVRQVRSSQWDTCVTEVKQILKMAFRAGGTPKIKSDPA